MRFLKNIFFKKETSEKYEKDRIEWEEYKKNSTRWKVFEKFKDGAVMDGPEIEAAILDSWALIGMVTFGFCSKGCTAKINKKGKEMIPVLIRCDHEEYRDIILKNLRNLGELILYEKTKKAQEDKQREKKI